jgi:hypothetical protein
MEFLLNYITRGGMSLRVGVVKMARKVANEVKMMHVSVGA